MPEHMPNAEDHAGLPGMPAHLVRVTVSAAVLFAAAVTVLGQQSDGQPQTPTFRGGVDAVQIDAFVTDANGRPVRGLTVDDFEVYREEQAQPITTFATVDIPVVKSPAPLIADEPDVAVNTRPDGRIYMFMLSAMTPDMALRTRHLLHRFMDQYFGDNDMAAVVVDRGLVTDGQDFTYSRRLIRQAIDKWGGGGEATAQRSEAGYSSAQSVADRGGAQDLRERMEFFIRIPGHRKFVLWFTDNIGFDAYDVVDYNGGVPSLAGEHVHAAVAAATRGNIRIYPISPQGLNDATGQSELERRMDFRAIADVTGGMSQVGSNDFDGAFARMVEETSSYYVLGVEAAAVKQGRYVRFNVRVKHPGLQVKARPGYAEQLEYIKRRTKPAPTRTPVETAIANPISVPGVPMRVVATPFKGDGRRAAVALTVDLEASTLSFGEKEGKAIADLQLRHMAIGAKKDIYPEWRYAGEVTMSAADRERVRGRGLRVVSQLDLPKGRYQIRVASASGGNSGSVVYDNNKRVARDPAYQITVNAVLLDAAGRTVRQVSDRRSSQAARGASGGHGFSMLLPLTQVPSGDYVIQVESRSERNPDHVETRRIPVRVEASSTPPSRGTS